MSALAAESAHACPLGPTAACRDDDRPRSEEELISYPIEWFDPQSPHWRTVQRSQRSAYEGGSLLGTRGV